MTIESESFTAACIPKFDGDYDHWSLLMENLLRSKELWSVIQDGCKDIIRDEGMSHAHENALEEAKLKDLKEHILKTITQKDTSKQLWDSMKVRYQGNERVKRTQLQRLRRSFEMLEMKVGESVIDYFGRVMVIANDMRNYGKEMEDVKIVVKILRTLTKKFNFIVCSIEESKDIDKLSVDELQSSLLVHEQKIKKSFHGEEQALKITTEFNQEKVGSSSNQGRGRGRNNQGCGRGRGRSDYNKSNIECFLCHKLGHYC